MLWCLSPRIMVSEENAAFFIYFKSGEQWRSSKDGDGQSWAAAATVSQPNLWDFWCWNTWRKSMQTWRDTDRPVLAGDWTHNLLAVRQLCYGKNVPYYWRLARSISFIFSIYGIFNETILITHVIIHCLSLFITRKNVTGKFYSFALTFLFYLKVYLLLFLETSPGFPLSSHCHCCQILVLQQCCHFSPSLLKLCRLN